MAEEAAKKCPNCGQLKFEPDWMENNPGCGMIFGGIVFILLGYFIPWAIIKIIVVIFFTICIIWGIVLMFRKQKVKTYKCKNCDFTEKYKKE